MFDIYLRNLKDSFYSLLLSPIFSIFIKLNVTPNKITIFGFFMGLVSCYYCYINSYKFAFLFWILNRFIDGLDGIYARKTNQSTDFGGYLDIITDFIIYSLIPIFLVFEQNIKSVDWDLGLSLSLMLGTFFVNSASLFMLSAIIDKRVTKYNSKELTTVTMPLGIIEGFETVIFFSIMIIFNKNLCLIFTIFSFLVLINIIQRLIWAYNFLKNN